MNSAGTKNQQIAGTNGLTLLFSNKKWCTLIVCCIPLYRVLCRLNILRREKEKKLVDDD